MSAQWNKEVAGEARRMFREFSEQCNLLRQADPGHAGWALLGYAGHQVELLNTRLKRLGVDTSFGLDPIYLLPDARPPAGDRQMMDLILAVREARRWSVIHYSGTRALCIALAEEALAMIVAAYHRRLIPVSRGEVEFLLDHMGSYILENMLQTWERCLVFDAGMGTEEMPTSRLRGVALDILTGWARDNINLSGQAGGRLRRALGNEDAPLIREEQLMLELPGAVGLAWKEMDPKEPLRPLRRGDLSLRRRIAGFLEDIGTEAAEKPAWVSETPIHNLLLQTDDLGLAGYEAREEAARQQLGTLEQAAGLSPQQEAVWKLVRDHGRGHGRGHGLSSEEIAEELGMTRDQVYVQKSLAVKKLREAGEAAGF